MIDDVDEATKKRRLAEIVDAFHRIASEKNSQKVGTVERVLVEKRSKRNAEEMVGRTDGNQKVILNSLLSPGEYADALLLSGRFLV